MHRARDRRQEACFRTVSSISMTKRCLALPPKRPGLDARAGPFPTHEAARRREHPGLDCAGRSRRDTWDTPTLSRSLFFGC